MILDDSQVLVPQLSIIIHDSHLFQALIKNDGDQSVAHRKHVLGRDNFHQQLITLKFCLFVQILTVYRQRFYLIVMVCSQLQLFVQLHCDLELYYTQLLDDVVKTCLSTGKYPGTASHSKKVLSHHIYHCEEVNFSVSSTKSTF